MYNYKRLSVSIEIGANAVKVLASEVNQETNKLELIAMHSEPYPEDKANVVKRGGIDDPVSVETALRAAILYLSEEECNLSEAHYYFVVTGNNTTVSKKRHIHDFQVTSRISKDDLDHIDEELSHIQADPGTELIYNSPRLWRIEGEEPRTILGQNCKSFVQENLLVFCDSQVINNIYEMIASVTAHNPSFYTYSPIASAVAILDDSARIKGSLVINIGEEVTEYCLFHNGNCNHASTVIVGVKHIANDLAVGLKIGYESAKQILLKFGTALESAGSGDIQVEFEGQVFRRKIIEVIINLRLKELISRIKMELIQEDKDLLGKIAHSVYLTGGGAQIPDIRALVKEVFKNIPVQKSDLALNYHQLEIQCDELDVNSFSTVVGLAIMGHTNGDQDEDTAYKMFENFIKTSFDHFKHFFKGAK